MLSNTFSKKKLPMGSSTLDYFTFRSRYNVNKLSVAIRFPRGFENKFKPVLFLNNI